MTWNYPLQDITYFLGRESLFPTSRPGMAIWREKVFVLMSRNARPATDFSASRPSGSWSWARQVEL